MSVRDKGAMTDDSPNAGGGERRKIDAPAPVPRDRSLPLSLGQERLLFLEQYEPNTARWNLHFARRWRGALDVSALERSLDELVRRHESLRTTFSASMPQKWNAPALRDSKTQVPASASGVGTSQFAWS